MMQRLVADGTGVGVVLAHAGNTVRVMVRDDGRGGSSMQDTARGGGFGIAGPTERVTALGGTLRTGPREDHGGEVVGLLSA
ncbi:hypothetical protein [Streptomyces massasporeus]|uniref:hypothetical protein n=1 Tax=Streptomyces massasporeus TaxID=67324 RepID=UPI0037F34E1E